MDGARGCDERRAALKSSERERKKQKQNGPLKNKVSSTG